MRFSNQKIWLFTLVAVSLVIKLSILYWATDIRVWEENSMVQNYLQTGQMAYFHDGCWKYNFGDPVYPYLLAAVYKVFGVNYAYGAALNILLSALSALLLYSVLDAFFDRFNLPEKVKTYKSQILFLSVAAFLFHPLIMYYEIKNVHPFASYVFFLNLGLWAMVKYFKKNNWVGLTLFAITMSLVILARETLAAILIAFFYWLLKEEKFKTVILKTVYVGIISSLFSVLWIWHIKREAGYQGIVPNNGIVMWMGSLPQTEGSNNFPDGKTFYAALTDSDLAALTKIPPAQKDSFYMAKYEYTLHHDFGLIAKMFLIKFKNFWLFRSAMGVDYPASVRSFIPLYKVTYVAVLLLALFASWKIGREAFALLAIPFAVSLIHAAVYVEMRHRIMFEPLLIFLAIVGVALLRKNKTITP